MQKSVATSNDETIKLVPRYGLTFFGIFQFCVYLTNIIIEACDPDGTYWLPWAIVIACVEIIFSLGIIASAQTRNFALFLVFSILWSLAIVAAVLISIAFRPECQQDHYQAILEVGLLVLVGSLSPWILAYELITMVRDRNTNLVLLEQDLQRAKTENLVQGYGNMNYPIDPVTNEFEVVLNSQSRPRNQDRRKSWEGHMTDMLLKSESFLSMEPSRVLEFLSDDNLPAENEITTFEAALAWMSAGDNSRRTLLIPLMGCVRFGLLDQQGFEYIAQSAKLDFELQRDPTAKSSMAVMAWTGFKNFARYRLMRSRSSWVPQDFPASRSAPTLRSMMLEGPTSLTRSTLSPLDPRQDRSMSPGKSRTSPALSPRAGTPQQGGANSILRNPADANMSFGDPNAPRVMTPRLLKTGWQEESGSFRPIASPWGGYEYGQGPALA